jgi:hypothetical protein
MPKIAILRSTSPLRKTSTRAGVTKQRFNLDLCINLAETFDTVIVGSAAADEVFEYMAQSLPRTARLKYRFYARSFFTKHCTPEEGDDGRNAGWQAILTENGIAFEPLLNRVKPDRSREESHFTWQRMEDFVTAPGVVFVSGSEGQLLYGKPTTVKS